MVWGLCRMLKVITPTWFREMPGWGISLPGLISGTLIGLVTVLAASRTPARKASEVSPLTAVSGNAYPVSAGKGAVHTGRMQVEAALGLHHAAGSRKNLILLTSSFALSIILFLGFGIGVDFMKHAIVTLRPYTPDVAVVSPDNSCAIPQSLYRELQENEDIRRIFGRSFSYDLPAELGGVEKTVMLVSYETYQFDWAAGDLRQGDLEHVRDRSGVLLVEKSGFAADTGDEITLETSQGTQQVTVAGMWVR